MNWTYEDKRRIHSLFGFIIVSCPTDHIIQLPISLKGSVMKIVVGMFQILLTLFCKLDGETLMREKN